MPSKVKAAILHPLFSTDNTRPPTASHVLQFIFLAHGGFSFPFAFLTTGDGGASASEIFDVLWQAIPELRLWGFKVNKCHFPIHFHCMTRFIVGLHFGQHFGFMPLSHRIV
jgi:hypothetical protein